MNPAHRIGLEVRDPLPIIQKIVDEIRQEVDLVVLLTHQNQTAPMQTDKEADEEVQRGFDEDYAMAGKLHGVDIIFGGHSDNGLWEPVVHPATGTMVCMTFGQGKYLGYLNLSLDNKQLQVNESKLIPVDVSKLHADEKVSQLVAQVRKEHSELTKVIAKVNQPGYRKYYRESTIGNFMADMMREIATADVGLVNSGSIRADLNKGDITTEELSNIYPFQDKYHVVEIDGSTLKDLLEYSYSLKYGLAQLSGIKCTYDSKQPIGQRLLKAKINGRKIKDKKKYTVVSSSFVANGGDGYEMLKNGKHLVVSELNMIDYFNEYLSSKGTIRMPSLGRQIDVSYLKN